MRFESLIGETLRDLAATHLLRVPDDGSVRRAVELAALSLGFTAIDASSNDYLGLGRRSVSRETTGNVGAGASRLIHGTTSEHLELETRLSEWVGSQSALLFSSTYAANIGLVSALGVSDSIIISDASNHASLIDGARLARAEVRIVPHLELAAIEAVLRQGRQARACWVVTESYFSMDGDGPDLSALHQLCSSYDACLIVDEAHALGVFGRRGAGRCAESGVAAEVIVGALGKAVGTHGGFIGGSKALRTFLWNKARSFVFSTAPSPQHVRLTIEQLNDVQSADQLRERLMLNSRTLRRFLSADGLMPAPGSFGPIVSIALGDSERALAAASHLRAAGVLAQAIRPPTVPIGAARLRLTVKATLTAAEVERLAKSVVTACAS